MKWCYHSNETSLAVLSHGTIYLVCSMWTKSCGVTIQIKPLQQYFHMVLFSAFYNWEILMNFDFGRLGRARHCDSLVANATKN